MTDSIPYNVVLVRHVKYLRYKSFSNCFALHTVARIHMEWDPVGWDILYFLNTDLNVLLVTYNVMITILIMVIGLRAV